MKINFRMEETLRHKMARIGRHILRQRSPDRKYNLSLHIRELIERECQRWLRSEYAGLSAEHFLLVTHSGDFFYCWAEDLVLNQNHPVITTRIDMKHTKLHDYLLEADRGADVAAMLRAQWRFNRFRISDVSEDGTPGAVIHADSDREGITTKALSTRCPRTRGRTVRREAVAHLCDYTRWFTAARPGGEYDNLQLDQRIPVARLRVWAIIDEALYRSTPLEQRPVPGPGNLSSGFGNLEHDPQAPPEERRDPQPGSERFSNFWPPTDDPDERYQQCHADVTAAYRHAVSMTEGTEDDYTAPALPERYFFYALDIDSVAQGDRITISWLRPSRPA